MTTDERLDAIDLEICGIRRLLARETRDKLAARGFDVTNYRLPPFPHPSETRAARRLAREAESRLRYGSIQPRSANGRQLLVREACGKVLEVR